MWIFGLLFKNTISIILQLFYICETSELQIKKGQQFIQLRRSEDCSCILFWTQKPDRTISWRSLLPPLLPPQYAASLFKELTRESENIF